MCFNVAIREWGVGGGVSDEPNIADGFDEMKLKTKFFTGLSVSFDLIECFLYEQSIGFRYLEDHLARLKKSAQIFNFIYKKNYIIKELNALKSSLSPQKKYKIKIVLKKNGLVEGFYEELEPAICEKKYKVKISNTAVLTQDNLLFGHKTTASSVRDFYSKAYNQLDPKGKIFDIIFFNESGFLTEGTKTCIFVEKNNKLFTPALDCGVLPGVMRNKILQGKSTAKTAYLTKADLLSADKIWLANSVVGMVAAELLL